MNRSAVDVVEVPSGVVTVTSIVPVPPGGDVTVIAVAESVTMAAALAPNFTDVAPARLVPVTVTFVPPAVEPVVGLTLETDGGAT